MKQNFYITTPIYYVNDEPHIGHAYTTILADVINRYYKLLGHDTYFLTGTDEHGLKVKQAASKRKVSNIEHVEEYHKRFINVWEKLNINYNQFIRTSSKKHIEFVQKKMQELYDKDEIYIKSYAGWYSIGEERFFAEEELVNGKDPISNKEVEWLEEKNYFFKMSKYQEKLIQHINKNPNFITPEIRKNEVLGFLEKPLKDLCISRPKSRLDWGIPLPFDTDYTTYVWCDALLNYLSATDGLTFKDGKSIWPPSLHLIGKDILTTHAVYWTCLLFALEITLPKQILAHGWWLTKDEKKMSKSEGNAIQPLDYLEKYGADELRYFLLRNMNLGQDANFSENLFIKSINNDLANDLGNALSRVHKLIESNFDSIIPKFSISGDLENDLESSVKSVIENLYDYIPNLKISLLLESISELLRKLNKYLDTQAPWKIAKELNNIKSSETIIVESKENSKNIQNSSEQFSVKETEKKLASILYISAETLRIILILLNPIMPNKTLLGLAILGINKKEKTITEEELVWGLLKTNDKIGEKQVLFPRIT